MEFTTIIVFLIPVVVARHNHRTVLESILKSTDNLYAKLHNDVQNVINNLFEGLNLSPSFPEKSRIKLFLTMQYDLNNMAAKNYDEHVKMIDAARPETGNRTSNGLALFKLIEKTLNEKPFNLFSPLEKKTISGLTILENSIEQRAASIPPVIPTSVENYNPSDPVFADSKEFLQFITDFIKKVDKLNETDFSKPTPLLPPLEEYKNDIIRPDIEIWQPPVFDNLNDTDETRRIFRGKRSGVRSYPFVVSIHLMDNFVCAGSILSSDLVLTAASCLQILYNNRFFRENPRVVEVRVGSDFFIRGGEKIPVLETFFYPTYDPKTLANNLVLLRLERHIKFFKNQRKIKRIEYERSKGNMPTNTDGITVVGWGSRKRNNIIEQFERMMAAKLDVYHVDECAEIYSRQFVTHKHFCAGFVSRGGGACNKDLGGPGIFAGVLVGVISFGAPLCGALDSPTVFTKLGYYDEWIDSIMEENGRALGVRTTVLYKTARDNFFELTPPPRQNPYITFDTTRGTVTPPTMFPEDTEEEEGDEESGPIFRGERAPKIQIQQLFPYTPTTRQLMLRPIQLIRNILYEDLVPVADENVNEMFVTTTQTTLAKDHILVNLSLLPVPGVHIALPTGAEKTYTMLPLTTSLGPRTTEINIWTSVIIDPGTRPLETIPEYDPHEIVPDTSLEGQEMIYYYQWVTPAPERPMTPFEPDIIKPYFPEPTLPPGAIEPTLPPGPTESPLPPDSTGSTLPTNSTEL